MEDYVELNRTFREISLSGKDDEFDYRAMRFGKGLQWSDILATFRTVILSEAGSGKTEEIRNATRKMRGVGQYAFFIRLEHATDDFQSAFEEGGNAEFDEWLLSGDEGWLFLDSVDEARLKSPIDFEKAIRKIGTRISPALQRVHIVLSSRGTAWRPVTDLHLCTSILPFDPPRHIDEAEAADDTNGKKTESAFKIIALDDLNNAQAETFGAARGVADVKQFVKAIDKTDSWSLAARPDDLSELIEFWKTNGRIGNRFELMQASVARRLAERDQNRSDAYPLSVADAYAGAQTLAAAATMGQTSIICIPDGIKNTKGLKLSSALPGWDDKKLAALLSRPIFDEALYGTVRFHHRTTREYLTAVWFKSLIDRQTSQRNVESLFFRDQYGLEVIVPSMRPVLVWLILLDERMRDRALKISPELIFEGGEPKALPAKSRRKILNDVCATLHKGVTRNTTTDYRAVQRFADKDIATDVIALIQKYSGDPDVLAFLMRIVWQGELADALNDTLAVALDKQSPRYARMAAFRAVAEIGSVQDGIELRDAFLAEAKQLERDLLSVLIEELPPTPQSVAWLLSCFAKLKEKKRSSVDGLPQSLDNFIRLLPLDLIEKLLSGLNVLICKRPIVEKRFCLISKRHGWLIKSAAQAAERLIDARHPAALNMPTLSILQKLPAAQEYREWDLRDIKSEIPKLVPAWPELNDHYFWYDVAQARRYRDKKAKQKLTAIWQVSIFGAYWKFETTDFDRMLSFVNSQSNADDRRVALTGAFQLYVRSERPRRFRDAMIAATRKTPFLKKSLDELLNPEPPSEDERKYRRLDAKWKREQKKREETETKNQKASKEFMAANLELLRDPKPKDPSAVLDIQHYLHERMRQSDKETGIWSYGDWESLIPDFGPEIAQAFRDGIVKYWRNYKPRLRSEGKAENTTPFRVIFGLTGVNIEARETEHWVDGLNAEDADMAFRYAMDELNGFPEWLPNLYEKFTAQVGELLLREVDRDLRVETAKRESHYVLSDLAWSGTWAWKGIGQEIFSRLVKREPVNLMNLDYMLRIVQGADIEVDKIVELAKQRASDKRTSHAARWFAIWASVEPESAIDAISARLASIKKPAAQKLLAMQFITALLGGRRNDGVISGSAYRTPEHLKHLYLLMHRYIRVEDDIERAGGGVYSPGLRDDAQDARNNLFSFLKEIPGKDAYLAMMEIGRLHPDQSYQPWMLHHAKTKAEQDADLTPWSIDQTLDFQESLERTPATHRELFDFAALRLMDLKDNLENGDSSVASILAKGATLETDMRKYIGDWCRSNAAGRYQIPQEEELADGKKPDLRFLGNGFDAPVPAELKLAENWSGISLFERLENQLCRDYLRDIRSNRGIFLLVRRGGKQKWTLPSGTKVDFAGLIAALQKHWLEISDQFSNVEEIKVIGVDLTVRQSAIGMP